MKFISVRMFTKLFNQFFLYSYLFFLYFINIFIFKNWFNFYLYYYFQVKVLNINIFLFKTFTFLLFKKNKFVINFLKNKFKIYTNLFFFKHIFFFKKKNMFLHNKICLKKKHILLCKNIKQLLDNKIFIKYKKKIFLKIFLRNYFKYFSYLSFSKTSYYLKNFCNKLTTILQIKRDFLKSSLIFFDRTPIIFITRTYSYNYNVILKQFDFLVFDPIIKKLPFFSIFSLLKGDSIEFLRLVETQAILQYYSSAKFFSYYLLREKFKNFQEVFKKFIIVKPQLNYKFFYVINNFFISSIFFKNTLQRSKYSLQIKSRRFFLTYSNLIIIPLLNRFLNSLLIFGYQPVFNNFLTPFKIYQYKSQLKLKNIYNIHLNNFKSKNLDISFLNNIILRYLYKFSLTNQIKFIIFFYFLKSQLTIYLKKKLSFNLQKNLYKYNFDATIR